MVLRKCHNSYNFFTEMSSFFAYFHDRNFAKSWLIVNIMFPTQLQIVTKIWYFQYNFISRESSMFCSAWYIILLYKSYNIILMVGLCSYIPISSTADHVHAFCPYSQVLFYTVCVSSWTLVQTVIRSDAPIKKLHNYNTTSSLSL